MDERPSRIEMPGREARVVTLEGVTGRAVLSDYEWHYDEPPEKGGNATAPAPVDHLLGSLGACFAVTVKAEALKHEFGFEGLDITTSAEPETGFIERIDLHAGIATDQPENRVEKVVSHSERECNILHLIREDIPVELDWERLDTSQFQPF